MKVKVKGLVFVGFAAMIFAANAMAANEAQTVTSKAFTDATYQAKTAANQAGKVLIMGSDTAGDIEYVDVTSTYAEGFGEGTSASNLVTESAVADALSENGGVVNSVALTINQNNIEAGSFNTNQATASSVDIVAPDWDLAESAQGGILNKPTISNDSADITSATASDTKELPTTYAVKTYVDNNSTSTTVAEGTTDGTIAVTTDGTTTQVPVHNAQTTTNLSNDLTTDASSTTKYPSVKVVKDALDAKVINDATLTVQLNGTPKGTFTANDADNTTINIDGVEVTSNRTQTIDSNSTSTQYPSAAAVYDAIQDSTGGLTIPAQNANVCTAQHPCALVNEAGTLHWYTMAQAGGYAGGEPGDAPATPANP